MPSWRPSGRTAPHYEDFCILKAACANLLFVLGVAGAFALPEARGLALGGILALALALVVRPGLLRKVPAKAAPLLLVLGMAWTAADFLLHGEALLGPVSRAVALLGLARAASARRRRREDLQLAVLALFLLVLTGVSTLSATFAVFITLFAAVGMLLLLFTNIAAAWEEEGRRPAATLWTHFTWRGFARRLQHVFGLRLPVYAGGLFAALITVSAGIFAAVPRLNTGEPLPFLQLSPPQARTGFSEEVEFGDVVDIQQDNGVALRVEPPEGARVPASPYWRMCVLDRYAGGIFRTSPGAGPRLKMEDYETIAGSVAGAAEGEWTFFLEPGVSRYLPLTGPFAEVRLPEVKPMQVNGVLQTLATVQLEPGVLYYRVRGLEHTLDRATSALDARLSRPEGENARPGRYPFTTRALELAEADRAALQEYVAQVGVTEGAEDFARAAADWLRKERGYSLHSELPAGEGDRLVRWIASGQPGHCELYAGSFVLLARAAGYPARLVTGFKGGDWNGFEGYFMVRHRDAHAWAEILDEDAGVWRTVDPTPGYGAVGAALVEGSAPLADTSLAARLDSLRMLWYRRILRFDRDSQLALGEGFVQGLRDTARTVQTEARLWTEGFVTWLREPWTPRRWAQATALLLLLGMLLVLPRTARGLLGSAGGQTRATWGPLERFLRTPLRRKAGRWLRRLDGRTVPAATVRALQSVRYGPRPDENILREAIHEARRSRGRSQKP